MYSQGDRISQFLGSLNEGQKEFLIRFCDFVEYQICNKIRISNSRCFFNRKTIALSKKNGVELLVFTISGINYVTEELNPIPIKNMINKEFQIVQAQDLLIETNVDAKSLIIALNISVIFSVGQLAKGTNANFYTTQQQHHHYPHHPPPAQTSSSSFNKTTFLVVLMAVLFCSYVYIQNSVPPNKSKNNVNNAHGEKYASIFNFIHKWFFGGEAPHKNDHGNNDKSEEDQIEKEEEEEYEEEEEEEVVINGEVKDPFIKIRKNEQNPDHDVKKNPHNDNKPIKK